MQHLAGHLFGPSLDLALLDGRILGRIEKISIDKNSGI